MFGEKQDAFGFSWFFLTYFISGVTATLGVTKLLQVGPCSVLSNEGTLGGLLTWRFVLTYFAIFWSLVKILVFWSLVVLGALISITTTLKLTMKTKKLKYLNRIKKY